MPVNSLVVFIVVCNLLIMQNSCLFMEMARKYDCLYDQKVRKPIHAGERLGLLFCLLPCFPIDKGVQMVSGGSCRALHKSLEVRN